MGEIPGRCNELAADLPLAVLCHSGVRSNRVAHWLAENGFARVANIAGGIDAWATEIDPGLARY
jgi:rhodanese-related sulfurtransferase